MAGGKKRYRDPRPEDHLPTKELEAVALAYDSDNEHAPKVVAKGQGHIAQNILDLARDSGVTIHRDADLVQVLGKLEIDTFIPVEVYATVAQILSYVYEVNDAKRNKLKKHD